jgi:hypothetical protein
MMTSTQAEEWPMPVDKFLAGNYLDHGDIVLARREWSPTSMFIRWATDSQFSHAGMVFASPSEPGYSGTFIIEAIAKGIDITSLREYMRKGSVVAVKRFRGDWYGKAQRDRVRGILLQRIRDDYSYGTLVKIGKDLLFDVQRHWSGMKDAVASFKSKDWKPPNEFICSGLIQIGLVEAISEFILRGELPPWTLNLVVFDPEVRALLPQTKEEWERASPKEVIGQFMNVSGTALEAVTPAHIAADDDDFEWRYLISDGKVYRIDNGSEVRRLMAQRR